MKFSTNNTKNTKDLLTNCNIWCYQCHSRHSSIYCAPKHVFIRPELACQGVSDSLDVAATANTSRNEEGCGRGAEAPAVAAVEDTH